jgi:SAM-dependent methyltransferase
VLRHADLFACPACTAPLHIERWSLDCDECERGFAWDEGIPRLFWPTERTDGRDVTAVVQTFYEETPFPNYDDLDTPDRLQAKAEQGLFARLLNEQIPHGATVLECGCGTGQLSNYLGLTWGRSVFGTDICLNSLRLAHGFKERHAIDGTCFLQMNLFRPAFRPESFDIVISNGVLHHTADPAGAFRSIVRCAKPGGFIIVGLYNSYGRLTTDLRRLAFRLTGDHLQFLDPRLRRARLGEARWQAWFRDQYKHPHESKHTFDEVLQWFDSTAVAFVNSDPKCSAAGRFSPDELLFEPHPRGTALQRVVVQLGMLVSGGGEGGFFVMIGRKRSGGTG